jgi:uncharacterized membrane protein YeaQ/YmgE (transglycosylase-associated protein family)
LGGDLADFTAQNVVIWVAVGGLFGWIADAAFKAKRIGTFGNIAIGILGAFAAAWASVNFDVWVDIASPFLNQILTAFLGAIVLLAAAAIIDRATG